MTGGRPAVSAPFAACGAAPRLGVIRRACAAIAPRCARSSGCFSIRSCQRPSRSKSALSWSACASSCGFGRRRRGV
eukprot:14144117-Alexandrium_andersonii.AAC.1